MILNWILPNKRILFSSKKNWGLIASGLLKNNPKNSLRDENLFLSSTPTQSPLLIITSLCNAWQMSWKRKRKTYSWSNPLNLFNKHKTRRIKEAYSWIYRFMSSKMLVKTSSRTAGSCWPCAFHQVREGLGLQGRAPQISLYRYFHICIFDGQELCPGVAKAI